VMKGDKVMRGDGAWFYLTSELPEAGMWQLQMKFLG
jgi:hypothetical protein